MAQDPRKLRKLLEILTQFGVTRYETDEIKIDLVNPVALANKMYDGAVKVANTEFSMDNYDKEQPISAKDAGNSNAEPEGYMGYSDDEILNWSAG